MKVEIIYEEEIGSKYADRIVGYKIKPPIEFIGHGQHFGIDPGTTNVGVAELSVTGHIYAYQIKMKRNDDAVERMFTFYKILSECLRSFNIPSFAVVEGASYADRYRQVELAEIRTSGVFWLRDHDVNQIKLLSPMQIRKQIFGNGRTKADSVWTNLPADAAAAISCAYSSMFTFSRGK